MATTHHQRKLVETLRRQQNLSDDELSQLIESSQAQDLLQKHAMEVKQGIYGNKIYMRGLIEFTNICKNDCYYCGIRKSNHSVVRYRLTQQQILECCREGYHLGFRTFVLQGGEDPVITDDFLCDTISKVKSQFPNCALTLSIGERPTDSYRAYYHAGADRYLLRHETATEDHYHMLHPLTMDFPSRLQCLLELKKIGFETGSGFMVGSPFQTTDHLVADLRFLQKLQLDMIGIGPYLPHAKTPFSHHHPGDLAQCLRLISILRLMFPFALIPSTTALGTIHPHGREKGMQEQM